MKSKLKRFRDLSKSEVEVLFRLAGFEDCKITKLEAKDEELLVYAESEWNVDDESLTIEDPIVTLYTEGYSDECDFYPGFEVSMNEYIQWALWCGLIEKINFEEVPVQ